MLSLYCCFLQLASLLHRPRQQMQVKRRFDVAFIHSFYSSLTDDDLSGGTTDLSCSLWKLTMHDLHMRFVHILPFLPPRNKLQHTMAWSGSIKGTPQLWHVRFSGCKKHESVLAVSVRRGSESASAATTRAATEAASSVLPSSSMSSHKMFETLMLEISLSWNNLPNRQVAPSG